MDSEVLDIGSRRQLLIDDYVIAATGNLRRTFHRAGKHGPPVMVPGHPWEGGGHLALAECVVAQLLVQRGRPVGPRWPRQTTHVGYT